MVTPLHISIALHYHTTPGDYGRGRGDNNFNAPAVQEYIGHLVSAGLLEREDSYSHDYKSTPALSVWIEALQSVPFPIQQWVIPGRAALREGEG